MGCRTNVGSRNRRELFHSDLVLQWPADWQLWKAVGIHGRMARLDDIDNGVPALSTGHRKAALHHTNKINLDVVGKGEWVMDFDVSAFASFTATPGFMMTLTDCQGHTVYRISCSYRIKACALLFVAAQILEGIRQGYFRIGQFEAVRVHPIIDGYGAYSYSYSHFGFVLGNLVTQITPSIFVRWFSATPFEQDKYLHNSGNSQLNQHSK